MINQHNQHNAFDQLMEVMEEETGLGLEDWLGLCDDVILVVERLEVLAERLHDLPCRACGGRTAQQPPAFTVSGPELANELLEYVSLVAARNGYLEPDWDELFGSDVLEDVLASLDDSGRRLPMSVARFIAGMSVARVVGWSDELDEALAEGWFEDLLPVGRCVCPAKTGRRSTD